MGSWRHDKTSKWQMHGKAGDEEEMSDKQSALGAVSAFNHLAIAVPDIEAARRRFADVLGLESSDPVDQPDHGVRVSFVKAGAVSIELLEPLGDNSPIAKFLERNPRGGLHHVCLGVADLDAALEGVEKAGVRLASGPAIGAHAKPVAFLHPADFCGVLVELEEE